jgi:hypothetical protein
MQKYLFLYRTPTSDNATPPPSPEQMQAMMAAWGAWKAQFKDQVIELGDGLKPGGCVLHAGVVTDGAWGSLLLDDVDHLPADRKKLWTYFKLWPNVAFDVASTAVTELTMPSFGAESYPTSASTIELVFPAPHTTEPAAVP